MPLRSACSWALDTNLDSGDWSDSGHLHDSKWHQEPHMSIQTLVNIGPCNQAWPLTTVRIRMKHCPGQQHRPSKYVLPLLGQGHQTPTRLQNPVKNCNRSLNPDMVLGSILGLVVSITPDVRDGHGDLRCLSGSVPMDPNTASGGLPRQLESAWPSMAAGPWLL